jgi:hypothetical protein
VVSKSKDKKSKFGGAAFVAASLEKFEKVARFSDATVRILNNVFGENKMVIIVRSNSIFIYIVYG